MFLRTEGKDLPVFTCMCGSTHDCRCVVDGSGAIVASLVLLLVPVALQECITSLNTCTVYGIRSFVFVVIEKTLLAQLTSM